MRLLTSTVGRYTQLQHTHYDRTLPECPVSGREVTRLHHHPAQATVAVNGQERGMRESRGSLRQTGLGCGCGVAVGVLCGCVLYCLHACVRIHLHLLRRVPGCQNAI